MPGTAGWRFGAVGVGTDEAALEDDEDETATRSHEGHMVSVVGGLMCMYS